MKQLVLAPTTVVLLSLILTYMMVAGFARMLPLLHHELWFDGCPRVSDVRVKGAVSGDIESPY